MSHQMLASELILHLQSIIDEHGDLPCIVNDADTSWDFELHAKNVQVSQDMQQKYAIEFRIDYYNGVRIGG